MEENMHNNQYDDANDNVQPPPPPHHNCPRCNSSDTKFSYYNNYSTNQPRYYCRSCRRYWTQGGALREVPVGGGSRRARTSSIQSSSQTTDTVAGQSVQAPPLAHPQLVQGHGPYSLGLPDINGSNFFYPEGTIFTSVTAIQSVNQPLTTSGGGNMLQENVTVFQEMNVSATIPQVLPPQFHTEYPPTHSALVNSWSPFFGNMGGTSTSAGVGDIPGSGTVRVNNDPQFNPNWPFNNDSQNHPGNGSS